MKTVEDLPEDLKREFDELLARKNAALIAMELETLKTTAGRCLKAQKLYLYSIALTRGEKLKTLQRKMSAWKKRTAKLISENLHPSEGRRLREVAPKELAADPVAYLRGETTAYLEFLKAIEKRLTENSAELEDLLKGGRIRLGHMVQRTIPYLSSKPFKFSATPLVSLMKSINESMKSEKSGGPRPAEALTLEAKTLDAFTSWMGEANEIIENLNVSLTELFSFDNLTLRTSEDWWIRYRFLTRMYIYEYARFRPMFRRFLKNLWHLGHIDQATRRGIAESWELLNYAMIEVRNQISHSLMPVLDEERSAFLVTTLAPLCDGIVVTEDTSQLIQPSQEIALLAEKIATELSVSGRNAVAFLQVFTEERYENIKENFPEWDSFKPEH